MNRLAIESATGRLSACIDTDGRRFFRALPESHHHTATISGLLSGLFDEAGVGPADLGLIAVSNGPGSFTSIRVGMSLAFGLGTALGIPVEGVGLFETIACRLTERPLAVAIDARRGRLYAADFMPQPDSLVAGDPRELAFEEFAAGVPVDRRVAGCGPERFIERLERATGRSVVPVVPDAGDLLAACDRLRALGRPPGRPVPLYIARPLAEENLDRGRSG